MKAFIGYSRKLCNPIKGMRNCSNDWFFKKFQTILFKISGIQKTKTKKVKGKEGKEKTLI